MLRYTFDVKHTVRVYVPARMSGVPNYDPDEHALKAAGKELGIYLYWNDVTVMNVKDDVTVLETEARNRMAV